MCHLFDLAYGFEFQALVYRFEVPGLGVGDQEVGAHLWFRSIDSFW